MTRQPIASSRVLVVISIVAIAVLLLATSVQAGDNDEIAEAPITYVVAGGDSLWDIAAEVTPNGGDVRATLSEIRSMNGLTDSTIRVGEVLSLPPS